MDKNQIEACGRLIRINRNSYGLMEITILVDEYGKKKYVPISLSKRLPDGIKPGDMVMLSGRVKGFRYYDESFGKWKSTQYFAATSVSKVSEVKGAVPRHFIKFYATGTFGGLMQENGDWVKMKLRTNTSKRYKDYEDLAISVNRKTKNISGFNKGDKISIISGISIAEKVLADGAKVKYKNLILEEIALVG